MKSKIILLLIMIIFQSNSFGQNYFNENSIWHQRYTGCAPNICNDENYKYVVDGDTIINNEDYLKIRKTGSGVEIVNFTGIPDTSYYDIDNYHAAIREEGKKVYFIWANSDIKRFLYDFEWEVGDTVKCPGSYCIIVDSIGTVDFGADTRKKYFLSGTGIQSNIMIEGVGFGSGLLRVPAPTFEWGGRLVCYKQDDNVLIVSDTDSCEFQIPETPVALPVELTSFRGIAKNCNVQLNWSSTTEENLSHYVLERSENGADYRMFDKVEGQGGLTLSQTYQYVDMEAGIQNYYRIQMVNLDGTFEYSNVVFVDTKCTDRYLIIYPNPIEKVQGKLQVKFLSRANKEEFEIVDMFERVVKRLSLSVEPDVENKFIFDVSDLPAGSYYIRLSGSGMAKQFIIQG